MTHTWNQEVESHILSLANKNTHKKIDINNINSNISTLNYIFDSLNFKVESLSQEVKNNLRTFFEEM